MDCIRNPIKGIDIYRRFVMISKHRLISKIRVCDIVGIGDSIVTVRTICDIVFTHLLGFRSFDVKLD